MTDQPDAVSALRVQRDSAHKELTRLQAENRYLRKHQAEIRDWLADAIQQYEAARDTPEVHAVSADIHQNATAILEEARRLLAQT